MQTGKRAVMFVERQRFGVEEFEIGAECVEKPTGRCAAAFFLPSKIMICPGRMTAQPDIGADSEPYRTTVCFAAL